jgi:hypothetical protein
LLGFDSVHLKGGESDTLLEHRLSELQREIRVAFRSLCRLTWETRGAKIYETNLRYYSRRPGCGRPVRGLVYAVLVAAHVSEPAATTVYGLTPRRLWATTVVVLALVGVVIGGLSLAHLASRFGAAYGRIGAFVALGAVLIAVVNGGLNLAIANGGPGTGNGVVGGRRPPCLRHVDPGTAV